MSEFIKKRVIRDLIEEIADLDAASFELMGHKVIELIESKGLVHHGLNKDHRPVGYTVDTFSQDFTIVGEYSTGQDYFEDASGGKNENKFTKIENDISHAIDKAGSITPAKIYLVSSAEEPPSFRGKFNKTDLAAKHSDKTVFLDSRQLAEKIFEYSRDRPQAAEFFRFYLPDFSQNLDNYEYYGLTPPVCANHQSEPLFREAIRGHFASGRPVCVLHGLSGSGKTQAAIDFVHSEGAAYGNYLWVAGDDWGENVPLTAIKRSRGGVDINVAGVFNSTRTLLVVDDLSRPVTAETFAELEQGFALGGCVLVTSQVGEPNSNIHLPVPLLSSEVAYAILGENRSAAEDDTREFVEACRFCPLILAVTREVAKTDGVDKGELYREVLTIPDVAHQPDGRSVMERILQRLTDQNRKALVKIANSGCTTFDSKFLTKFIGANARFSLQRLAIVTRTEVSSALTVHDLICSAVRTGEPDGTELAAEVVQYVERYRGEMVPSVLRQIHLSAGQLLAAHRARAESPLDWLTYALLQLESGDRLGLAPGSHSRPIRVNMSIAELLCVIDLREAHSYTLPGMQRTAYYSECAEEYGKIAAKTGNADMRVELRHHQGKALRRSDQLDDALDCFRAVLRERPGWHAAHGQIAHAGTQRGATEAVKMEGESAIRHLIGQVLADVDSVPLRVSLAALSKLRSYSSLSREVQDQAALVKHLADVVAMAALAGFQQFYEGFLAFTSLFSYQFGEHAVAIAEIFPDMLAIYPDAVDERQWPNACEALANVATAAAAVGKRDLAARLNETACAFAEALSQTDGMTCFKLRVVAKTYVGAGKAEAAITALAKMPDSEKDHWVLYQQAKAELAANRPEKARESARAALDLASKDTRATNRLGSYSDLVGQCHEASGNIELALSATKEALGLTTGEKYRQQLTDRIAQLERRNAANDGSDSARLA
ncbi:tetratricopeptide (TPR) repeat protein [Sinorhizobium meliloti]|uniref:tetratricopeptide repeat protein n=1 Tax=Rhizobium meliloti TaxID=382 RepID=UPI0002F40AC3|nr:tetratricopeptide repeat protein [Sinorhizobium meliloti]MBP2470670.1 tetratricopeptide (TPR) repeat protein [Sinorhizobium meliloti]MDE3786153.1 tetratricopeptide repeat protein [Sinorhizobium meliloti]MDE4550508.1 tetratricopeptide repeat protein [Sinorhizobium meliloti]MDE4598073.1 tetratricopeptide repeat protein [Sinorhizobium meliloti]MQW84559.1 tetratricopeptide repeat protein [Sinorhizobium meliloti]